MKCWWFDYPNDPTYWSGAIPLFQHLFQKVAKRAAHVATRVLREANPIHSTSVLALWYLCKAVQSAGIFPSPLICRFCYRGQLLWRQRKCYLQFDELQVSELETLTKSGNCKLHWEILGFLGAPNLVTSLIFIQSVVFSERMVELMDSGGLSPINMHIFEGIENGVLEQIHG